MTASAAISMKPCFFAIPLLCLIAMGQAAGAESPASTGEAAQQPPAEGWTFQGKIKLRLAKDIKASNWSVGAETMDRDFTVYDNWKQYLGPLGAKHARIQSGWAKTEKKPGVYDFAWLDAIVDDMLKQGVKPWMCVCYGNTIYPGGGQTGLGAGLPSGAGLNAWEKYAAALAEHYKDRVDEWEIWNEPNSGNAPETYAELLIRTAEAVRARQPQAKIIAFGLSGTSPKYVASTLQILRDRGKLSLVNQVSYHPYTNNPDSSYRNAVKGLREAVAGFSKDICLRQGENGCPSQGGRFGALANHAWTELSQAKWALRRLLGDLGRDIPSSYFSIADMHYTRGGQVVLNHKGLLKTNPDKTISGPKSAYYAVQHLTAVFDDGLERIADYPAKVSDGVALALFAYAGKNAGGQVVAIWEDGNTPGESNDKHPRTFTFAACRFTEPVYVDLRTGAVFSIPAIQWRKEGAGVTFADIPVYDSPILIAERSAVPVATLADPQHSGGTAR